MKNKILVIWPPETYVMPIHSKIPKRWTYLSEIISYLNNKYKEIEFEVLDCLNPKYSIGEIMTRVSKNQYLCIIIISRIEGIESSKNIITKIKNIKRHQKIIIYGDICEYAPNFFKRYLKIDAIVKSGDWENSISEYIDYILGRKRGKILYGIDVLKENKWIIGEEGRILDKESWFFPDIKSKLFDETIYNSLSKNELTLGVSRGCPFNCKFCPVIITNGTVDRRKKPEEIIKYIKEYKKDFNSFKFFSPTFTLNKIWVKEFCNELIKSNLRIKWTATTRPDCLNDPEMIRLMKKSGCYKIALGVETLDKKSHSYLKKFNSKGYEKILKKGIKELVKNSIDVTCLMMLGIKGQTKENILKSFIKLKKWGVKKIRTTAYSPKDEIKKLDAKKEIDLEDIIKYDKMTYLNENIKGINYETFLNLIFNTENFKKILK